jgi:arylsulfatase A-like enzyme
VDQHPEEFVELYADCPFESCPQETRHPWIKQHPIELQHTDQHLSPGRRVATIRDNLQGYFAAVTAMDRAVGRLREELTSLGIERDTLVVFTSDNGFNCGHHGIWGKGNATFPQNMYDNSVKVPLIVAQPGAIAPGGTCDDMLSGYDVLPTILDLAGLGAEVPDGLPGRSFIDALAGERSNGGDRPVVVYDEMGPTRMIRTREWKYVHRYPYGPHELFDLVNDPGERINLLEDERILDAAEEDRRGRAASMRRELELWFARYADPRADGRLQPVTGRGQTTRVGEPGVDAFHHHEVNRARTP